MKVVILAGGLGTRISEETDLKPKPMIKIGEYPIIWNIMKIYSFYGYNEFIICLGYKGEIIKEYFSNYFLYNSDVTFNFTNGNEMIIHNHSTEPWSVTLADTGKDSMTGGRLKRIQKYVGNEPFMMTYGDGVGDIDIRQLVEYHQSHGKLATVTATQPSGRFGALNLTSENCVERFAEKIKGDGGWVNAGFFVLQPEVFNYISDDHIVFEKEPLEEIARQSQLMAYKHTNFWHPMDTLRDKNYLEQLWKSGRAPWKIWS
ncbi:glucose-1-phosphate cytidylyltransferase [Paenibacillus sp. N4]|uniref:glucose-1-phosphate cytidylyltransferase n=1 Tax=Paenibacillus vietnamensis TaxID=2590547 RepID=UPI001CD0689B|nr:glucose-1-phosphate cytidylyltransferase [Paenibacillus vietnamensis]MCA0754956.1 glucose-1-phosphate cytidylyltransferase [Paenibacillus vietnamensis]